MIVISDWVHRISNIFLKDNAMQDEIIIDGNEQPVDQDAANAETDKLNADTKVIYTPQEVAAFFQKFNDDTSHFSNELFKWRIQPLSVTLSTEDGVPSTITAGFQVINNIFAS